MAHVCDGVLHSGLLAVSVAPTGAHPACVHVKRLPAPCTRQPTPPRALPTGLRDLPATWTRQLDDRTASYVRQGRWYQVNAHGVLWVEFEGEPEAVLEGVALRVVDGTVRSSVVNRPKDAGTEGSLKLGAVTYVPDGVGVPRALLDPEGLTHASTWTGPRVIPAAPSAFARMLCVPQPRVRLEAKHDAEPFALWVTAFAIVARGCAGQTLRLAAAWQMLRSVRQRLGTHSSAADPRVAWLVFLLKQERPAPESLRLAYALRLSKHPDPTRNALCYSLDSGHTRRFVQLVNRLQSAYPFPAATGVMERLALTTNTDPEGHFLYLPFHGAKTTVVPREEAAPYEGPERDIAVSWRERESRKAVLSVVAVVALLHLYRNPAWLRALECAQLRNGVRPNELRGWGSILRRMVLPPPELLARCRTELHAVLNAAFNILQTSSEKGSPSPFALAMDLVQALRRTAWSDAFIQKNTRPDAEKQAEKGPKDRAWHRCYLQYALFALHEDWGHARCEQCDRDAANAPYEPAAGVVLPNDTHMYLVLPEYALWCALGRDDAAMALAGVNNRAAAEEAVLRADLGTRVEGQLRLFNRADERHPSFL